MQLQKYTLSPDINLLQINFEEHSRVQLIYLRKLMFCYFFYRSFAAKVNCPFFFFFLARLMCEAARNCFPHFVHLLVSL